MIRQTRTKQNRNRTRTNYRNNYNATQNLIFHCSVSFNLKLTQRETTNRVTLAPILPEPIFDLTTHFLLILPRSLCQSPFPESVEHSNNLITCWLNKPHRGKCVGVTVRNNTVGETWRLQTVSDSPSLSSLVVPQILHKLPFKLAPLPLLFELRIHNRQWGEFATRINLISMSRQWRVVDSHEAKWISAELFHLFSVLEIFWFKNLSLFWN